MLQKLKLTIKTWLLGTVTLMVICFLTGVVANQFGHNLPSQPSLDWMLQSRGWVLIVNVSLVVLIMPILEEFLFRGLLFKLPMRWIPVQIMAPVSALLFMAAHYIQMPFPNNAFLALFAFGLIQCRLYHKTQAIWCPIVVHTLFNTTNLILLFAFPEFAKVS